jgi:hypothetical protein
MSSKLTLSVSHAGRREGSGGKAGNDTQLELIKDVTTNPVFPGAEATDVTVTPKRTGAGKLDAYCST